MVLKPQCTRMHVNGFYKTKLKKQRNKQKTEKQLLPVSIRKKTVQVPSPNRGELAFAFAVENNFWQNPAQKHQNFIILFILGLHTSKYFGFSIRHIRLVDWQFNGRKSRLIGHNWVYFIPIGYSVLLPWFQTLLS